ncbi:MAG: KH domain-containing protein [Anaerovoracaceae bacterium]|nr:KH domain-containing protein [Anaerovoracaceae bacterium]
MVELVETIARSLVDEPDEVEVTQEKGDGDTTIIRLRVAEGDMGKVIGRQGRIAKAIRTVVKAAAVRSNEKVVVEIVQ